MLVGMAAAALTNEGTRRRNTRTRSADLTRQQLEAAQLEGNNLLHQDDDVMVVKGAAMEHMTAFVDVRSDGVTLIYTSPATWDTLSYDMDACDQFVADMVAGGDGMKFIVADRGPYLAAVRKQAHAEGTDVVAAKDAITDLMERANALVTQAASLNAKPSKVQQQTFSVRYAALQADLRKIETKLNDARGLVDLAAGALWDMVQ